MERIATSAGRLEAGLVGDLKCLPFVGRLPPFLILGIQRIRVEASTFLRDCQASWGD